LDRHALDRSDTTAQLQRLSVADPQSGYAAWFQGGHGPVGLPISHRCPQGSVMRPSRQPCSSLTGEVTVAPAPDAASTTASGSSTTSRVRLVPPPSQLGGTAHSRRQRWRSRSGRCPPPTGRRCPCCHQRMRHDRAERGLVERDRLGGVLDPQFGLDVAHGESSEAAVSCQIPSTLPAGSANSATRRVPSGYGGLTICPPEATTAVRVCSTSAT